MYISPNKHIRLIVERIKFIGLYLAPETPIYLPNYTTIGRLMMASTVISAIYQDTVKCCLMW